MVYNSPSFSKKIMSQVEKIHLKEIHCPLEMQALRSFPVCVDCLVHQGINQHWSKDRVNILRGCLIRYFETYPSSSLI